MTDLSAPGVAKQLAKRIQEDIDEFCVTLYDDGHRNHLGASLIGDECKRKLWYIFRWVKHDKLKSNKANATADEHHANRGRSLRLFNRGHKEEDRFIEWLEGIGIKLWADDLQNNILWHNIALNTYQVLPTGQEPDVERPSNPCWQNVSDVPAHIKRAKADGHKFPQYRISAVNGHFGGSLDGVAILPERYGINEPVLAEFKTYSSKNFAKLKKEKMVIAKPEHFAQTSCYGNEYKFNYVLYVAICKDTDEMYIELVQLNHNLGEQMKMKAEEIITSQTAPPKLTSDATYYKCKFCNFNEICHKGAVAEVNCRSCSVANPAENGEWWCNIHSAVIPKDYIPKACDWYRSVTEKV